MELKGMHLLNLRRMCPTIIITYFNMLSGQFVTDFYIVLFMYTLTCVVSIYSLPLN